MTVESTITSKTFFPGGALAAQSLAGLVFANPDDVRVQVLDANGAPTQLLVRETHYTLGGNGATGSATITPMAAWATDVRWFVDRRTAPVQTEQFPAQQPLSSQAVERGLNRLTLIAQEASADLGRAMLAPPTEPGIVLPPVAERAGAALFFDEEGNAVPQTLDNFNAPAAASAGAAQAAAASAELMALAIQLFGAGLIYASAADGVDEDTGVADGEFFTVNQDFRLYLYKNDGGTAVEMAEFSTQAGLYGDLASDVPGKGAALVTFVPGGDGAVGRPAEDRLRELPATPMGYGAADDGSTSASGALQDAFDAGGNVDIPAGTYKLLTDVTPSPFLSWRNRGAFTGSATIATETDFSGFNYSADLRKVRFAEGRGSASSPVTDKHVTGLFSKHSNVATIASQQNPALAAQHYKWNASALTVAQAFFAESIDKAGNASGRTDFVEGVRAHGIGMGASAYGVIALGQVGDGVSTPNGKFAVAVEGETIRSAGSDAADPLSWTAADKLDVAFLATARIGVKPMAGFMVNPFNSVAARVGFFVGSSNAAQGFDNPVVDFASFATIETDVPYALYARGTSYAVISGPNNVALLRGLNAAGNAEHNLLSYGIDNFLDLGSEAAGIRLKKTALFTVAPSAAPGDNGEAVFQATSNTVFTIKYKGSDGTVRSGSITLS